jgi:hypothetical protein
MRELFVEDGVDSPRTVMSPDAAQEIRDAIAGRHVCPFCGAVRDQSGGACPRCSMENSSASRQATKVRIGPWYVFQSRNPAAPGMKFETLLGFVRKGRVKARSVVRGPTTHQLWRFAAHVKGLSREFGICYSCGGAIERTASLCQHCNRLQEPPDDPDLFLEGQEQEPRARASAPRREPSPTPLAAEDIVVPPLGAQRKPAPAPDSDDPLDAATPTDLAAKKGSADGFLSPQDLAAAFNLDFRPKGRQARQMQTHGQFQQNPRRPRRRRWGRFVFLLLVLVAAAGVGYALYAKPELRARVSDYTNQGVAWAKQKAAQFNAPSKSPPKEAVAAESQTHDLGSPQVVPALAPEKLQPEQKQPEQKAADQKASDKKQSTEKSSPWDRFYQNQPASNAAKPPAAQPTLDDMRKIYWEAIDAEAQGDFASAVKKYELIKKMPQDLWPRDLDLRLDQARKQVH